MSDYISKYDGVNHPPVRMIGNVISPIQPTIFGYNIDFSSVVMISDVSCDYSNKILFNINFDSSLLGSNSSIVYCSYNISSYLEAISSEQYENLLPSDIYKYSKFLNDKYYRTIYNTEVDKQKLQALINYYIDLWEKIKIQKDQLK